MIFSLVLLFLLPGVLLFPLGVESPLINKVLIPWDFLKKTTQDIGPIDCLEERQCKDSIVNVILGFFPGMDFGPILILLRELTMDIIFFLF